MDADFKNKLKKEVWRSDDYYLLAKKGSMDVNHPGMIILKQLASISTKILDLGCGEGTRLNWISEGREKGVGVDISDTAVKLARKNYPKAEFIKADLEKVPLKAKSFSLVYSAYVLEHLSKPEKVLAEAIRLLIKDGLLVLIAPNYGAPNRASPPFRRSRVIKFLFGLSNDLAILFGIKKNNDLGWTKVEPIASKDKYDIDWDTTIEPYIGSLIQFLKARQMIIKEFTSCWSEELKSAKIHQIALRFLGELGIYPFTLWGPHLVIVAQKNKDEN